MSLYKEGAYSVPSRVLALCEFLLGYPQMREHRTICEKALMPDAVLGEGEKRSMVRVVINESLKLGLVEKTGEDICLAENAIRLLRARKADRHFWPLAFMELLAQSEENHDLLVSIAWWLSLPVLTAPGDWSSIDKDKKWRQHATNLSMNDFRYTIFASWAVYLGFAWRQERRLIPDPTLHLLLRLQAELGDKAREFQAIDLLRKLATWCPVLDQGTFARTTQTMGIGEPLDARQLSATLSLALLRLEEDRFVRLTHAADAEAVLLDEAIIAGRPELKRVSGIHWLGRMEREA